MREEIEGVLLDVDEVFRFSDEERPQDRAHAYLERRGVGRTATDTAMQCAVRDMVRRAHVAGLLDGASGSNADARRLRAMARELLDIADGGDGE